MTVEQQQAFAQLPSMELVAHGVNGNKGVLVNLAGGNGRLYVLSPSGLLRRYPTVRSHRA